MEVVATLSQGRTAAAQCGLFTHKSVPVIFEPPCTYVLLVRCNSSIDQTCTESGVLTLEVSALKKKQVYVQNLLEETSQLQSSGTVTL